jgi:UDP-glucose 4-epimerase
MKILVTGGAGFIGSNIADALINKGHKVVIIDNLATGKKQNLNPEARFYETDITDLKGIEDIFAKEQIDIVDHHAAQIDVRKSVNDPAFDARINILGTINILENAKKFKIKKVIFASSGGTIYGECGKQAPAENAEGRPLSPYGIAKYSIEFYLKYYQQLFGLSYTILRYANIYGPRQDPYGEAGVVAIFANKILNGQPLNIYGDGKQTRDYVFVGDVVKANLLALEKGENETINIGTSQACSVNELFEMMAESVGYKQKPVYLDARPGELFRSVLDNKKAKDILGWSPQTELKLGLQKTLEFFKNNREGAR